MKTKVVAIGPEDERYAVAIVKTRRRRGCVAEVRNCAAEVRIPHSASYSVGEEFVQFQRISACLRRDRNSGREAIEPVGEIPVQVKAAEFRVAAD